MAASKGPLSTTDAAQARAGSFVLEIKRHPKATFNSAALSWASGEAVVALPRPLATSLVFYRFDVTIAS